MPDIFGYGEDTIRPDDPERVVVSYNKEENVIEVRKKSTGELISKVTWDELIRAHDLAHVRELKPYA